MDSVINGEATAIILDSLIKADKKEDSRRAFVLGTINPDKYLIEFY